MSERSLTDVDRTLAALPEAEQVRAVEGWVAAGDAARVAAVAAGTLAHKTARKAARKGVHVLKARGVSVEEAPRPVASPARVESSAGVSAIGYMTPVDPTGTQVLLYAFPGAGGGLTAVQLVVQRDQGILDGEGLQLSRKKLRALVEGIEGQGMKLFEAPAVYVQWRASGHVALSREKGKLLPAGVSAVEGILPALPEAAPVHPLEESLPRAGRATARVTEAELGPLEEVPFVFAWGPDETVVHELLTRMQSSAGGGLLVLSEAQRRDSAEEALAKTIDDTFGPRAAWVLDLRDTAHCLVAAEADAPAELLARSADELADEARPARDVAFVRWLYRHVLEAHAAHHHGQDEPPEQGGEPGMTKTPGGLYVP